MTAGKTTAQVFGLSGEDNRARLWNEPVIIPTISKDLSRPFPTHAAFPNGRRVGIRIVTFEACSGFTRVYGPPDRSAVQDGLCHDAPALPVTQLCRRVQLRSISSRHIPQGNGGDEDRGRLEFV